MTTDLYDRLALRREQRAQSFDDLVREVADGREPDLEAVEDVLAASDKTTADLQTAVHALCHRRTLRRQVDAATQAERDLAAVRRQQADADAALAEAQRVHRQRSVPLHFQAQQLRALMDAGQVAKADLRKTASPDLREQLAELERDRAGLVERRAALQSSREHELHIADGHRRFATKTEHKGQQAEAAALAGKALARANGHTGDAAAIDRELEQLAQRERELLAEAMQP